MPPIELVVGGLVLAFMLWLLFRYIQLHSRRDHEDDDSFF